MLFLWFVKTFHFGMSGETTSGTLAISRTRSKVCDSRSKSLSSFCSVPPWSVTVFYIKRSCLVSWRTWWSDALTLPYPSTSELLGLENVEDGSRCGNRIFLAVVIVLDPRTLVALLAWLVTHLSSWVVCMAKSISFRWTPSVKRVRFLSNSQDHLLFFEKQVSSRNQWLCRYGSEWSSLCLLGLNHKFVMHTCIIELVGCHLWFSD